MASKHILGSPFSEWLINLPSSPPADYGPQTLDICTSFDPSYANPYHQPTDILSDEESNQKLTSFTSDPLSYPTSVYPFVSSSSRRMDSIDSNATLFGTPPLKYSDSIASGFFDIEPCYKTPRSPLTPLHPVSIGSESRSLHFTPFEGLCKAADWMLTAGSVSPIVRKYMTEEPLERPSEGRSRYAGSPSFMDKLLSARPSLPESSSYGPATSAPSTPLFSLQAMASKNVLSSAFRTPKIGPPGVCHLSPLTPLTCETTPASSPSRKRKKGELSGAAIPPSKRSRRCPRTTPATNGKENFKSSSAISLNVMSKRPRIPSNSQRTFPANVPISTDFPLFYRRFPVSIHFQPLHFHSPCTLFGVSHPGGEYNPPRGPFDLYTPRFVKGKGSEKVGLCPICVESCERGGVDKKIWLSTKFSAFKYYHMQCGHGISATTGHPFSPPIAFRTIARPNPGKKEKITIRQGRCHKCLKWVAVEGIKDVEVKVKELFWWKHATLCHRDSTIQGEQDIFEDDAVLKKIKECHYA